MSKSGKIFRAFTPFFGVSNELCSRIISECCTRTHQAGGHGGASDDGGDESDAHYLLLRLAYSLFHESKMRFVVTTAGDPAVDVVFPNTLFAQSLMSELNSCTGLSFNQTSMNSGGLYFKKSMNIAYRGQLVGVQNILRLTAVACFLEDYLPAINPYLVQALAPFLGLKNGLIPPALVHQANDLSLAYCYNTAGAIKIAPVELCGCRFDLFAASGDLLAFNGSTISTSEAMRALTLMEDRRGGLSVYEPELYHKIRDGTYKGQWFIPTYSLMHRISIQPNINLKRATSIFNDGSYGTSTINQSVRCVPNSPVRNVRVWGDSNQGQDVNHTLNLRLCYLAPVN